VHLRRGARKAERERQRSIRAARFVTREVRVPRIRMNKARERKRGGGIGTREDTEEAKGKESAREVESRKKGRGDFRLTSARGHGRDTEEWSGGYSRLNGA